MGRGFRRALFISAAMAMTFGGFLAEDGFAQRGGRRGGQGANAQQQGDLPARAEIPKEWAETIDWRCIGPANMSGRITAFAVYEKDPTIWWAASASGGLLKTSNAGTDFEHQFDDQSTVSIGDVQVAPSDPNIVWVGTGESNPRNSVSWGDGVYKSTDGGKTWKNMGLKDSFQTGAIAIHPENPDIVYVGALGRLWGPNEERGLFKTTDGGATWEKVLYVDDKTGVVDIQLKPGNPDEMIVATYERERDGFDGNDPGKKYGPGSGLYKSTDGGKTFTRLTKGLPTCNMGRIGIDYYRADPNFVYAIIETEKIAQQPEDQPFAGLNSEDADVGARITAVTDDGPAVKAGLKVGDIVVSVEDAIVYSNDAMLKELRKRRAGDEVKVTVSRDRKEVEVTLALEKIPESQARRGRSPFTGTLGGQAANLQDQQGPEGFEYGGLYRSSDGGESWERINSLNPRPMYYSHIRVDPTDNNYVYVCGTSLYRSNDGGVTFTGDGGSDGIHVDHHALWIDPRDSRHMLLGNDGGVHETFDRMENWDHHNQFAIAQFYHVGVGPRLNYRVYGGLQDNGSWGGPSHMTSGPIVNSDWFRVGGGDGFVTLVDPNDADQIYFESQNGGTGRINLRTGERGFIRPRPPRGTQYRFNWKTPFLLSPHNSKIYYSAGNHVFRSLNKGDNIAAISPEITNTDEGAGSALSESPAEAGVIYVGTTDGAVWMTRDNGQNWEPIFSQPQEKKEEGGEKAEEEESESGEEGGEAEAGDTEMKESEPAGDAPAAGNDPVTGSWSGKMISDRVPEDRANFSFKLQLGEDGEVTGEMPARRGDEMQPLEGKYDAETGAISWTVGSERGSREYSGKLKDGKITGEMSAGGGRFQIEFEATRDKKSLSSAGFPALGVSSLVGILQVNPVEDPVSGTWIGVIENEELPNGKIEFTIVTKLDDKNRITGTINSPQGEIEIVEGMYSPENKSIMIYAENDDGVAVEINGKLDGNRLTGELDINGGAMVIDVTATREAAKTGDAPKIEAPAEPAKPEAKQEEKPATQEGEAKQETAEEGKAAQQPEAKTSEQKEAAPDPVSGSWEGTITSNRGDQELTMTLARKADNTVTGSYNSGMGEGEFSSGKYDPEKKELVLVADNGRFELEFSGKVENDTYSGDLNFNGGQFTLQFEAKRTSAAAGSGSAARRPSRGATEAKPLAELVPGPRWVSSIEASRFSPSRVYLTLDGHRSNDDGIYLFVSNDYGKTWKSIQGNLPDSAGSVRVLREDLKNENLLYLGCEFSAWFSVDRGQTWTRFTDLPTVAVHEFAIHPDAGEIVAGTHGRAAWVADVTLLRQMSAATLNDRASLMKPNDVIYWKDEPGRGDNGPREFRGENRPTQAKIGYSLGSNARNVSLEILDLQGETVYEAEAPETSRGFHVVNWDLRQSGGGGGRGGRGGRGGPRVSAGEYLIRLRVDGQVYQQVLTVRDDPEAAADRVATEETLQEWLEQFDEESENDQD